MFFKNKNTTINQQFFYITYMFKLVTNMISN